jgi:hypothetical protein
MSCHHNCNTIDVAVAGIVLCAMSPLKMQCTVYAHVHVHTCTCTSCAHSYNLFRDLAMMVCSDQADQ